MEGRFDWGRYDFGTFRRRDVLTMGRFCCKAHRQGRQTHGIETDRTQKLTVRWDRSNRFTNGRPKAA